MNTQPNELQHYGVKGMKWGVIRFGTTNKIGDQYSNRKKEKKCNILRLEF